jgi:hypothetical protein
MANYVTKNTPLFMSASDETLFEEQLRRTIPGICFLDGSLWEDARPPIKQSLADCHSSIVFLWDRDTCPQLPHQLLADGRARGPTSGVVIQYIRPASRDGILASGDIGIGYDKNDVGVSTFVTRVWKVLHGMNTSSLHCVDKGTSETLPEQIDDYVVGPGAVASSKRGVILKHCAADVYYRCA